MSRFAFFGAMIFALTVGTSEARADAAHPVVARPDAGRDAGLDAGDDGGPDAGSDACASGNDAGAADDPDAAPDGGRACAEPRFDDAGPVCCGFQIAPRGIHSTVGAVALLALGALSQRRRRRHRAR